MFLINRIEKNKRIYDTIIRLSKNPFTAYFKVKEILLRNHWILSIVSRKELYGFKRNLKEIRKLNIRTITHL